MKDLLLVILQNITLHPEEVSIDEEVIGNRFTYTITVNPSDMGRVIGRQGKVIKSIRSLAHIVAVRHGNSYRINVAETGEERPAEVAEDTPEEVVEAIESTPQTDDIIADALDIDA